MKRYILLVILIVGLILGIGLFFAQGDKPLDLPQSTSQVTVIKNKTEVHVTPELPVSSPLGRPEVFEPRPATVHSKNQSLEQVLILRLQNTLGRKVIFETSTAKKVENWLFVCGRPLEPNGDNFDYSNSTLAKYYAIKMVDDKFCALLEIEKGHHKIIEFDLGSTDNPYGEWGQTHKLPKGLIDVDE